MARVLKNYKERKAEILKTAWELFSERGYENTSVNAVIEKLGISKGTFYHYFSSKEDVIDALAESMTIKALEKMETADNDKTLSAIKRLDRFISVSANWKVENVDAIWEIGKAVYSDKNLLFRQKNINRSVELISPLIADIIEQGTKEDVFDVPNPKETAKLLMHINNHFAETNYKTLIADDGNDDKALLQKMMNQLETWLNSTERILGVKKGSFKRVDKRFFEAFIKASKKNSKVSEQIKAAGG